MELSEAVYKILIESRQPLHYKEIARRIVSENLLSSFEKISDQSINALIVMDIYTKRDDSQFVWVDMGVYALNPKFLAQHVPKEEKKELPVETETDENELVERITPKVDVQVTQLPPRLESVPEIVDRVLAWYAHKEPMHYSKVAEKAYEKGLIKVSGDLIPGIIYGRILGYTDSWRKRGEYPRFFANREGFIALTRWSSNEVQVQVNNYISEVRDILKERLTKFTPKQLEEIAGVLLGRLGLDEVTVHITSDDGTTSLSGILAATDFLRIKVTIRIIHTIKKIDEIIVQNLKSSLLDGEYGIIISSGDFMQSAWDECAKPGPVSIGIIDGTTFANLLIENNLMVARDSFDLVIPSGIVPFFAQESIQKSSSAHVPENILPETHPKKFIEAEPAIDDSASIKSSEHISLEQATDSLVPPGPVPKDSSVKIDPKDNVTEKTGKETPPAKKKTEKGDEEKEQEEEFSLDDDDDLSQLLDSGEDIDLDSLDINEILKGN